MLSVIIPANNEASRIGDTLDALLAQEPSTLASVEIVVAANGCVDRTIEISRSFGEKFRERGWKIIVLDIPEGGKPNALDKGDLAASGDMRVYLDADIICSPRLLSDLWKALDRSEPVYASGQLIVAPTKTWVSRHFANLWVRLPFITTDVPGAGLYAVNAAARARWDNFPRIIGDDAYVRLLFRPEERVKVCGTFLWPMVEGFSTLVKVRRRQDAGVQEIAEKFPHLLENEGARRLRPIDHVRLFSAAPMSYVVYVSVRLATRLGRQRHDRSWTRGR